VIAHTLGEQRFSNTPLELGLDSFNGRMETEGRTRRYWVQIEKITGSVGSISYTARYRLVHSALGSNQRGGIYVDEEDDDYSQAVPFTWTDPRERWLTAEPVGENFVWDQDVVKFTLGEFEQVTLNLTATLPEHNNAIEMVLWERAPQGDVLAAFDGNTVRTGAHGREFYAEIRKNYFAAVSEEAIGYSIGRGPITGAQADPDNCELANESQQSVHNSCTSTGTSLTRQRNLHTATDTDWLKGLGPLQVARRLEQSSPRSQWVQ
jgi:hypothetical protein